MSELEIAWLAGLYEGEATFGYAGTRRSGARAIRITLAMTDKDIVARAYELVGSGCFNPEYTRTSNKFPDAKPVYEFSMAHQEDCRQFMLALLPLMGERRGARFKELIAHIEDHPNLFNRGEGGAHGGGRRARKGCPCALCTAKLESMRAQGRADYYKRKEISRAQDQDCNN